MLKGTIQNNGGTQFINKRLIQVLLKPRNRGLTMVFDKGMGLRKTRDLLELCHRYIDFWKIGFGSSLLYEPAILQQKIKLVNSFNIVTFPGGTLTEIAIAQGKLRSYLEWVLAQGFKAIEVSDGTIDLGVAQRENAIKSALKAGLTVFTEVGKKDKNAVFCPESIASQMFKDLEAGASKVTVEARESGTGIMIFNDEGNIAQEKFTKLLANMPAQEKIIWETPLKKQQVTFLNMFGPEVNLGNIAPEDILSLASLRAGLRSDTLKQAFAKELV